MSMSKVRRVEYVMMATGVLRLDEARKMCLLGQLRLNGKRAGARQEVRPGDELTVGRTVYRVVRGGADRVGLHKISADPERISAPIRVHCGFHKCMTMYTRRIYRRAARAKRFSPLIFGGAPTRFRHFYHRKDAWMDQCHRFGISSLSGNCLDLDRFEDIKVVRFIRDPRDLVISSYFYHRKAGERWCRYKDPTEVDFEVVNGKVPSGLSEGQTLQEYVNDAPQVDGLSAEIEFRKKHFESMLAWPTEDERVKLFRYEDLPGNEADVFGEIFTFFEQPSWIVKKARKDAHAFRVGAKEAKKGHVRNPKSEQWRKLFTPELNARFLEKYQPLLERYGYPVD